jgi:hypothetical protein
MEQKQAAKEKREIYMDASGYEIMRMIKCPLANRDEIPYFAKGKAHPSRFDCGSRCPEQYSSMFQSTGVLSGPHQCAHDLRLPSLVPPSMRPPA